MSNDDALGVLALHRYFIVALRMRDALLAHVKQHGMLRPKSDIGGAAQQAYLSLYFTALYVVVEGWTDLGLHDPEVDRLLESPHTELLRRHRNGTAHFQRDYFTAKRFDLYVNEEALTWCADLHHAFSRYLLDWMREHMTAEERDNVRATYMELIGGDDDQQP